MRTNDRTDDSELYECWDCGRRTRRGHGRLCPSCGGELRNLSRPRNV